MWENGAFKPNQRIRIKNPVYIPCFMGVQRFRVQRSGLLLSLALLLGQQVLDETTNGSTGASGIIIHLLKFGFCYVLLIQRYIKLALDFSARSFCISKKTNELRICLRIESFSNIMHGGTCSVLNLPLQAETTSKLCFLCQSINLAVNSRASFHASISSNRSILMPSLFQFPDFGFTV